MGYEYNIKNIVGKLITKNQLSIPVDLDLVAKILNAVVIEEIMPDSVSGMLIPPYGGNVNHFIISVSKNQSFYRKQYTKAHEIGHIVLDHSVNHKLIVFRKNAIHKSPMERQADIFAAELLMPLSHFACVVNNVGSDLEYLTNYYKVSKQAILIRLEELKNYLKHKPYIINYEIDIPP